ncbi:histidine kinase [Gorillibacterium sp. CAU 1737]|uniref:sensor histidine kinase n=1 Tax=Gorillibacterium sp. CAU 1737 TaxID=3140362 RepID=UPI003261CCE1
MTIRTRLLIILPLLVLLMNSVAFFLFQSTSRIQDSYNLTLQRVLLYQETTTAADQSLKALYSALLSPRQEEAVLAVNEANRVLLLKRDQLREEGTIPAASPIRTGYLHLTETLTKAITDSLALARSGESDAALSRYLEVERIADFIRSEASRLTDTELAFFQPVYEQARNENQRLFAYGIAAFAFGTLLTIALAITISRSVTEPVTELMRAAERVSDGDLTVQLPDRRTNDELGSLYDSIRHMLTELQSSIERDKLLHEKEQHVKTLELQALQSQFHPHFLFNTLNVLSKLALLENAEKTSGLIVSLSHLLRYNLQTLDRFVTVRDEVQHVQDYLTIQNARFRDRIRYELELEDAAMEATIPSLLLQPLVENAFAHGIASMESGAVIRIEACRESDGSVRLAVSDNGVGMKEETRLALLDSEADMPLPSDSSTGLGTRNVFKRLRLVYGREDLVDIASAPGQGTTITLRIPPDGKEDAHVPDSPRG